MRRRDFLKAGAFSTAALGASAVAASSMSDEAKAISDEAKERVGFVLVHGSWHGAWCWNMFEPYLNRAGHITVSIDLPGHGLKARLPRSFHKRPLDADAFAAEPSYLAEIAIDAYADAVLEGLKRVRGEGATRVVLVGHSMGGVPITFAAARSPELVDSLVYVAAVALSPGKPGGAFLSIADPRPVPEEMTRSAFVAIPPRVGALRIDPRSPDPEYRRSFKARLAADVDDDLLDTVMHMITPDAPFNFYQQEARFPDAYADIKRTFVRCTEDYAVHNTMADAMIASMDDAWPQNPTQVIDIPASHEVMFSRPEETAAALMKSV